MTPAKWCANGKHCASAPALGVPAPLSRSNTDSVCHACRERRVDAQLAPAPPAEPSGRAYTLTEAAESFGVPRWKLENLIMAGQLRALAD